MKKTILLATSILLLTACSQQKSQPVDITDQLKKTDNTVISDATVAKITGSETKKYSSKEPSVSFDYPSNWEVDTTGKNHPIQIISPKNKTGDSIVVNIPEKSFEEYEKYNKVAESLKEEKMSVKENSPTDNKKYTSKEYGSEGGLYYLIKIDKIYIGVQHETYLDQKQKEQLDIILNSISSL